MPCPSPVAVPRATEKAAVIHAKEAPAVIRTTEAVAVIRAGEAVVAVPPASHESAVQSNTELVQLLRRWL